MNTSHNWGLGFFHWLGCNDSEIPNSQLEEVSPNGNVYPQWESRYLMGNIFFLILNLFKGVTTYDYLDDCNYGASIIKLNLKRHV